MLADERLMTLPHRLSSSLLILMGILFGGCDSSQAPAARTNSVETQDASFSLPERTVFTDVTESVGLSFVHLDGANSGYEFPRSMGSGCAWLDANGDQRLDILLVQGGQRVDIEQSGLIAVLYLQNEDGQFTDASGDSGLSGTGYGMGAAVGDVDNDGDADVYLTKYGPDQLFLNDGSGRFKDVSIQASIVNPQWSTAAAMVDVNQDGWLDLVVANYVDYFPGTFCADAGGRQDFCGPQDFRGTPNRLFLNRGRTDSGEDSIRFEDCSATSGIAAEPGKSLGLVCRDFDGDGDTDLLFANDGEPNQLWIQNDGEFVNEAAVRGVAVNRFGEREANMGTEIGDFCGDDQADLLITHLSGEMNTLWQGDALGYFSDQTSQFDFGPAGLAMTGFGVVARDLNCDGRLDMVIANGKVKRDRHHNSTGKEFWADYAERNQIFFRTNDDFQEVSDGPGGWTHPVEVSRGLAAGDFDRDGDPDLLVTNAGGQARLYRNDVHREGHWLGVVPWDAAHGRAAYGATITVVSESRKWSAEILPHTSYLSSHEPIAHFGLGDVSEIASIEVLWPDDPGSVEEFAATAVDQRIELVRGTGLRIRDR